MSNNKKEKYRDYTFLLYPESIPEDWELKLSDMGIEMAVSPLHDSDKFEGDDLAEVVENLDAQKIWQSWSEEKYVEELDKVIWKKPHYHVIYIAKNPVTADGVRKRIQRRLGKDSLAKVKPVETSVRNVYEYLTHESKSAIEANKYIYDAKDIKLLSGFDINNYITLSKGEESSMINKLFDVIMNYQIENYQELENKIRDIERVREWKRRDAMLGQKSDGGPVELTEEQENEMIESQHGEHMKAIDDVDDDEFDGEDLTLGIARKLYLKRSSAYLGMFNGNYQARMKHEGVNRGR